MSTLNKNSDVVNVVDNHVVNTSNNILGYVNVPLEFKSNHWLTMRELRSSVKEMKRLNSLGTYDIAIDKETEIYSLLLKDYLDKKAA